MLRHGPVAGSDDSQLFHTGTLTPSRGLQIEFQASGDGGGPDMAPALETSDGRHRFGLDMAPGTNLRVQRKVTTGKATWYYSEFSPPLALENGAWYVVRLFAGDTGSHKFKAYVWKRDDPSVRRYYELATTPAAWGSQAWRLSNWVARGAQNNKVLLDSYLEFLSPSNGAWS